MTMCTNIVKVAILNYDEMVADGQAIVDICRHLDMPDYEIDTWVSDYLRRNIKIEILGG